MTEAEWRACKDPQSMLEFVGNKTSDRKLRLFATGCCFRIWRQLDDAARALLLLAERYCDGTNVSMQQLRIKRQLLPEHHRRVRSVERFALRAVRAAACVYDVAPHRGYPVGHAQEAAFSAPQVFLPDDFRGRDGEDCALRSEWRDERAGQSNLVREIFGNPFRPVVFSPLWRTSTAVALAAQMYEVRDFSAMPILADALQDAGCDNDNVLSHGRGPGPHVRGCWVVDLVLGKE